MMNFKKSKYKMQMLKKERIKETCSKTIFKKGKKKKGFTLIEVIAVIAIIGILSAVIVPNVSGYIKEAKKVKVVDQCRKVVMAAESYKVKYNTLADSTTIETMKTTAGVSKYFDQVNLSNLPDGTTLGECSRIVNGGEFKLVKDSDDVLEISTPTTPKKGE